MQCLVAVEPENLQNIIEGLHKFYPSIEFEGCSNADDLFTLSKKRPDIVVISRFLPGHSYRNLIPEIPLFFSLSHVVLLAGNMDEEGSAYIRLAEDNNLHNYVTGMLPGDRPYTLMVALLQDKAGKTIEPRTSHVSVDLDKEPPTIKTVEALKSEPPASPIISPVAQSIPQPSQFTPEPTPVMPQKITPETSIPSSMPQQFTPGQLQQFTPEPDATLQRQIPEPTEPLFVKNNNIDKGLLVLTTANKGGVGKTTAATTLAIALANVGIDVIVADLDLEGPNICGFFKLEPSKGIEFLANRQYSLRHLVNEVLLSSDKYPGLRVLPGVVNRTVLPDTLFDGPQMNNIVDTLRQIASVVIVDTPPGFWVKPWLPEVFGSADIILSIVDQSVFSKQDATDYAPYLLSMGVMPNKIKIVLNRFSPKLHNAKQIEKAFCSGFRQSVSPKELPRIIATIPSDWNAHGLGGYKGEAVGLDDPRNQWHTVAEDVAVAAGFRYTNPGQQKKKGLRGLLGGLFS